MTQLYFNRKLKESRSTENQWPVLRKSVNFRY